MPLWQVLHLLVTTSCVWFHLVGIQLLVLWQATQLLAVGICRPGLPVAPLPLWQLPHWVADVYKLWSGLEALQLLVVL